MLILSHNLTTIKKSSDTPVSFTVQEENEGTFAGLLNGDYIMAQNRNDIVDDCELFVNSIIGEDWHKLPAVKKMIILKKYNEIQEIVKKNYFS